MDKATDKRPRGRPAGKSKQPTAKQAKTRTGKSAGRKPSRDKPAERSAKDKPVNVSSNTDELKPADSRTEGMSESGTGSCRFFREASVADIISKRTGCNVSKQAIALLAGGLEFIASEILSEALRYSPENKIDSKAIFRTLQDDADLNEFVKNAIVVDKVKSLTNQEFRLTGYQIE
jgi:hypothetical protein